MSTRPMAVDAGEPECSAQPDHVRPAWPGLPGRHRMMKHLEFEVTDPEPAADRAVGLGVALLAPHQPHVNVRVLVDPAGRPFCLHVE
jgi:hypothetical protein